tara:strand:- start:249 stop:1259 length:1011 start_codon:yes stop_codon:yes gene_type:complete
VEKINYLNTSIYFDESFLNLHNYIKESDLDNLFFLIDANIYDLYVNSFNDLDNIIIIPPTEDSKSLSYASILIEKLLTLGANKGSYLIGIGGGITCDITGFIASIFMRGINFAFIPTTLLAITDASLGGKNGVNFNKIKNIVGTINEPNFIIIDLSFLKTLKKKECCNGFAEIIKHACVSSSKLFYFLEKVDVEYKSEKFFSSILRDSISIKLDVVLKDLKDLGRRRILNFGHTFGHAIESKNNISHGQAISLGIILACNISNKLGYLKKEKIQRIHNLLAKFDLPTDISKIDRAALLSYVLKDKKAKRRNVDFIVLEDIGKADIINIPIEKIIYE